VPGYEFPRWRCGLFERWCSCEEAGEPMPRPVCGAEAKPVYSMTNSTRFIASEREAMNRVEESAYGPEVTRSKQLHLK